MKRAFQLLLFIGALIGLFGLEAAYASSPRISAPVVQTSSMAMDANCMAMMAKPQPAPEKKPCKGLTLDCIAAMGCVVPLVTANLASGIATPRIYDELAFWPTHVVLTGKSLAPDPEPPTILG